MYLLQMSDIETREQETALTSGLSRNSQAHNLDITGSCAMTSSSLLTHKYELRNIFLIFDVYMSQVDLLFTAKKPKKPQENKNKNKTRIRYLI